MDYLRLYEQLKKRISFDEPRIDLEGGASVHNFRFHSSHSDLLPGGAECTMPAGTVLDVADAMVLENREFSYHVFQPASSGKSRGMILLLHGFNEKNWNKYLPWAARLMEITGKTVVLFPMAFHMNRAPAAWSDARPMRAVSNRRKEQFPEILQSSLLNAAISTRLHTNPQRFIWSGLQTFEDIRDFVECCRRGDHPLFEANPTVDIVAYSVGGFLSQVLLLSNPRELFSETRLFLFCSGPVFNRMSPVSKFILDSEANVRLYSYLIEHLDSHVKHDARLSAHLDDSSESGTAFRCMLNYKAMADFREEGFRRLAGRFSAIALAGDDVIPPYEVENTLKGRDRSIPISIETLDFPYRYRHEDPFPALAGVATEVNDAFDRVFDTIAAFLS